MKRILCAAFPFLAWMLPLPAQITAQGQGGKTVFWNALGLEQSAGQRFVNKNVLAYSRHSRMDSWNPVEQPGVWTVREEAEYKISRRFGFSAGIMYAWRAYADSSHPSAINEIRFYPRLYHRFRWGRLRFSQYLRADFRLFSGPRFTPWHKPFELRARYLMKMSVPLDRKDRNYLVFVTEFLAAADRETEPGQGKTFSRFRFTENRSSVFYRHHIPRPDMFFDIGIMHQTWRGSPENQFNRTWLLQVDWVFINPFRHTG